MARRIFTAVNVKARELLTFASDWANEILNRQNITPNSPTGATSPLLSNLIPTTTKYYTTETDGRYQLVVDVPGLRRNDIHVTVLDDVRKLIVKGSKTVGAAQHQSGGSSGTGTGTGSTSSGPTRSVELAIQVPRKIDLASLSANVEDGILTVSAPILTVDGRSIPVHDGRYPHSEAAIDGYEEM
ncbi:hypothetical protein HK102_000578 [Quaeritorhiza haematococci]|nr:hypothetical protein HK102_000578 [Quaeritorhiza haematococci]